MSFIGKIVLFVAPNFYGYEEEIKNEMQNQGIKVTEFYFKGFANKRWSSYDCEEKHWDVQRNELSKVISSTKFDFLFVINAKFVDSALLNQFKISNAASKTIIYLWDTLKNLNWEKLTEKLKFYDYRFSFDRTDCEKFPELRLKHRPNFYHPYIDTLNPIDNPNYRVASVMSAQPDRIRFINDFSRIYPKISVAFYVHLLTLKSIPAYWLNHSVIIKPKFIKLKRLKITDTLELLNNSESVLDIPAKNQMGLPFRSLDAIGLNKKLITTNKDVLNYDFYHPNNVLVIPPNNISDIGLFLDTPFSPISEEIRNKYALSYWINSILNNENISYNTKILNI